MSDLKNNIFKNILDKKFNQANKSFQSVMKSKIFCIIWKISGNIKYQKSKIFTGIDDFKKSFVYNPRDVSGEEVPEEVPTETPKEEPKADA